MHSQYDCFISHASEDKDDFVRPLVNALQNVGLNVWYDELSIKAGNSIRESIEKGLLTSEAAIVVLSPNFFIKPWTKNELSALTNIKNARGKDCIIPIWYNVSKEDVLKNVPLLADICAINNTKDFSEISKNILDIVNALKNDTGDINNEIIALNNREEKKKQYLENIIFPWCKLVDIENWDVWTSHLMSSGQPHISEQMLNSLDKTIEWLMTRIWCEDFSELNNAFYNFHRVLKDFYDLFIKRARNEYGDFYFHKFYKNEVDYGKSLMQYEYEVYLIEDLILELTRAANYICDKIREILMPEFMLDKGYLLITYGPCLDLSFKTVKVLYSKDAKILYPGLQQFCTERLNRDIHMGEGDSIEDPQFISWYNKYD